MTRYEAIEKAAVAINEYAQLRVDSLRGDLAYYLVLDKHIHQLRAALALPEDGKVVNAELYGLAIALADSAARSDIECVCATAPGGGYWIRGNDADVDRAVRYLSLRESSGEPMPYKVVRDGGKVRFE